MKRLFPILLCGLASLLFGCNTTPDPVLTVTPENLAFSAEGGAQTVQVKANNPWTASASGSGLSVNPSSGEGDATVTVTATATSSTNPLSGTVTFRSEGLAAPVSVTQDERKVIQVGDVMVIPAEGGTFAVDIQYNTEYTVEVESGAQSWISFLGTRALQSRKLEFQFAENQNTEPRTGKVTVRDNSGKAAPVTLNFVQEEKKVITVGDVMTIPAEGGTFAVDIQYNTDFDVVVESGAQSWITFVATRALKSGKLEFRFAENQSTDPRQGKVTVKDKSGKVSDITLTFVQEEKKVITVGDVMGIPAEGGTFAVDVQYNTDVVVEVESAAQSWIHFVAVRALTSGKLEFSFDANPNPDARTGKVTVKDKNGKVNPITLTFVQAEKKVITVGDVMTIPAEGGTFEVDVQYNTDVVVDIESAAQSWIHFVAVRALTSGKLEFSFDANPNPDARTGKVTVKDKNGKVSPITLNFVQEEGLVIRFGEINEIPYYGGEYAIQTMYNTLPLVEVDEAAQSWIKLVQVRSLNNGQILLSFEENGSEQPRSGKLLVKDYNGKIEPITITLVQEGISESIIKEKAALAAFYEAMGGQNWKDNTNWLSDKPLRKWFGVGADDKGHVKYISFWGNGLKGYLPKEIGDLTELEELSLSGEYSSTSGYRPIPEEIGNLKKLKNLSLQGLSFSGTLPASLFGLTELEQLYINNPYWMDPQPIPPTIKNLKKLKTLGINYANITGELPPEIGELYDLEYLRLNFNNITGSVPESFGNLANLTFCEIRGNQLSGTLPASFRRLEYFWKFWAGVMVENQFTMDDLRASKVPGPRSAKLTTVSGKTLDIEEEIKKNDYTILFKVSPEFSYSMAKDYLQKLKAFYDVAKDKGLGIITYTEISPVEVSEQEEWTRHFIQLLSECNIEWDSFIHYCYPGSTDFQSAFYAGQGYGTYPSYIMSPNELVVIGPENTVQYCSMLELGGSGYGSIVDNSIEYLEKVMNTHVEHYESSDYSLDGKVKTLQKASIGNGIDIVITGDAFSDRLIADGTFEALARNATENLFGLEPLKSMRNRFNVYLVNSVSKNEEYFKGNSTAFSGLFGSGSWVGGDNDVVLSYTRKAVPDSRMDNSITLVLMNSGNNGGTCSMFNPEDDSVYAGGASITWIPYNDANATFGASGLAATLVHEVCGHGLGKLADEYYYFYYGVINESTVEYIKERQKHNWYVNVDFTSDPTKVLWSRFASDSRYASEKIGAYEGGYSYYSGVWRPTEGSIMFQSGDPTARFNAPSRCQLYKRIMTLSEGPSWTFDYETFVNWDLTHKDAKSATRSLVIPEEDNTNHVPPVVVGKTWRQVARK
ncbi:MAG: hypothetical protein IK145_01395 [Bacteroidales bacterium]|nr:hypothetical protein [Bacteroidales bacterium]